MSKKGIKVQRIVSGINAGILALIILGVYLLRFLVHDPIRQWMLYSIFILLAFLILYCVISIWLKPKYQYYIFGYQFNDDYITIRKGFIWQSQVQIPFFRIQNVELNEGFFMRKYNLVSLTLSTAGGNHDLFLLDKENGQSVNQMIKQRSINIEDTYQTNDTHEDIE